MNVKANAHSDVRYQLGEVAAVACRSRCWSVGRELADAVIVGVLLWLGKPRKNLLKPRPELRLSPLQERSAGQQLPHAGVEQGGLLAAQQNDHKRPVGLEEGKEALPIVQGRPLCGKVST